MVGRIVFRLQWLRGIAGGFGLAMMVTGCSPVNVINATAGAGKYRVETSVAYGAGERQTYDIYQPAKVDERRNCFVVFVYGGSWQEGSKDDYRFVGANLAKFGCTVMVPDYRVHPEVVFPEFVEDVAQALQHPVAKQYRGNQPLVLMGHSAGAQIAGMLAYDGQYLDAVGSSAQQVAAYIAIAGPHDYFLPSEKPEWVAIFGEDPKVQVEALTVNHVNSFSPPTLIIHGEDDEIVTPRSAHSLARRLQSAGITHELKMFANVGHVQIMAAMAWPLGFLADTSDEVQKFLAQVARIDA